MGNDKTYAAPLSVTHDKKNLHVGLCFSLIDFGIISLNFEQFLHPNEINYFSKLNFPRRQFSYLLGRFCGKQAIAFLTGDANLSNIFIDNGVFQQPIVKHKAFSNVQVSLSHTHQLGAAIAFPEEIPMAIDIEEICSKNRSAIDSQLTQRERQILSSLHSQKDDDGEHLTLMWTVKEALSKVLKCGLMINFELLEINSIKKDQDFIYSTFRNFHQYETISFQIQNSYCSIVYPKKTIMGIDLKEIRSILSPAFWLD
jgi:phosphopantetheinyl transferase